MILQAQEIKPLQGITRTGSIGEMVADLKKRGYQFMFIREADCLYCIELGRWITADGFMVDECYHFEDVSNPDRDRLLYAISSTQRLNGFLIDANFVYQDNISLEMAQKLAFDYSIPAEA